MVKKCIQCGNDFDLSGAEVDYYKEKGLDIPKRCKKCRQANRLEKNSITIPSGKARRQQRKSVLRSVPTRVLVCLVAIEFVYISIVRGGDQSSSPSNPQTAQARDRQTGPSSYSCAHGR